MNQRSESDRPKIDRRADRAKVRIRVRVIGLWLGLG